VVSGLCLKGGWVKTWVSAAHSPIQNLDDGGARDHATFSDGCKGFLFVGSVFAQDLDDLTVRRDIDELCQYLHDTKITHISINFEIMETGFVDL
jgi:hypothetical protein